MQPSTSDDRCHWMVFDQHLNKATELQPILDCCYYSMLSNLDWLMCHYDWRLIVMNRWGRVILGSQMVIVVVRFVSSTLVGLMRLVPTHELFLVVALFPSSFPNCMSSQIGKKNIRCWCAEFFFDEIILMQSHRYEKFNCRRQSRFFTISSKFCTNFKSCFFYRMMIFLIVTLIFIRNYFALIFPEKKYFSYFSQFYYFGKKSKNMSTNI